ncbi:hypothetical protein NQ317_007783 [Molorchus minor]|uniref:Uncharacterized protein n=1 Tax=Molorchus minor TaxID=1323400 RepID=A0ABQ9JVU2_9CUCU|nr:hypothetical protein NQ317_007783 [Molorchus minor]
MRFEILDKEQVQCTVFPDNPINTRKIKLRKFSDAFRGPHMWNEFSSLQYNPGYHFTDNFRFLGASHNQFALANIDADEIKERKYWAVTRQKVLELVEDLIMITIYVVLLYLVILKDKHPLSFLSNIEVVELVNGIHSRTILLEDVERRDEFEDYINTTLVHMLQYPQWYGKYVLKDPGMTVDNVNKYIGIGRFRQHRSDNNTCKVLRNMRFITDYCYSGYSDGPESRHFSEGWMGEQNSDKFARMDEVWKYRHSSVTGTFGYMGKFAYYPGGGYIATLGRTMKNSLINIKYLFRNKWIDPLSRCIFIEFLLYNSNSNLFNSVSVWFEISTVGYIGKKFHVDTAKLLLIKEETGVMITVIFVCFLIMLTVLSIKMIHRFSKKKQIYLKDTWHIVDVIIILMTAVLVFIATLRLWKLLRFMLIIKMVEKTLLLAATPLLCLLLCQVLITFCFLSAGTLLFGDKSYDFQNLSESFATLLLLSLNLKSNFDLSVINSPIAYLYYAGYMIVTLVYVTLYITIITICYAEAQIFYSFKQPYGIPDYVKEQFEYYSELGRIKWKNMRLRGGNDESGSVYPKADEHRYADCITIPSNKLNAMALVAKCSTIVNLFRSNSNVQYIFYIEKDENGKMKVIDDMTLIKMEKVVDSLLQKERVDDGEKARQRELYKAFFERQENDIGEILKTVKSLVESLDGIDINEDVDV